MSQFEKFKEQFDKDFPEIYDFIETYDIKGQETRYNGKYIEDLSNYSYDSYGNSNDSLRRVYYFGDYDIYVMFYGFYQSHYGTEWQGYKEVKKTTKTIETFE